VKITKAEWAAQFDQVVMDTAGAATRPVYGFEWITGDSDPSEN